MTPAETLATLRSYVNDVVTKLSDLEETLTAGPDSPTIFEATITELGEEASWVIETCVNWEHLEFDDTFEELLP